MSDRFYQLEMEEVYNLLLIPFLNFLRAHAASDTTPASLPQSEQYTTTSLPAIL